MKAMVPMMKAKIPRVGLVPRHWIGLSAVAWLGLMGGAGWGQQPVIESFGRNGDLVATNLEPGSSAMVEWAPSVEGPWTNTWAGLDSLVVDSNGMIRVGVPMFYRVRGVPNPDPARWAYIPPGTFVMGSPATEAERRSEETQHQVTLTQWILMGRYEVTQGEYLDVVGSNPSYFTNGQVPFMTGTGVVTNALEHPVEMVSWPDATNYCALLTEREAMAGRIPAGYRYRLPTEAEWEHACRAGTTNAFYFGEVLRSGMLNFQGSGEYDSAIGTITNPEGTFLGCTAEAGSSGGPNAFGLYDLHGSVWEWCQDFHGPYPGTVVDPQGPVSGYFRVARGGSWLDFGKGCRSAARGSGYPLNRLEYAGFRVVLAPGPASIP